MCVSLKSVLLVNIQLKANLTLTWKPCQFKQTNVNQLTFKYRQICTAFQLALLSAINSINHISDLIICERCRPIKINWRYIIVLFPFIILIISKLFIFFYEHIMFNNQTCVLHLSIDWYSISSTYSRHEYITIRPRVL